MKQYKGYEVTAINTNGYWYGYASLNGKTVFSGTEGFLDRDIAIAVAEANVSLLIEG
jgi:hypothetical protein